MLRGEMEHSDGLHHGYLISIYSRFFYGAEDRYCTVLATVQWCRYFENMYNVLDSDMRERT